MRLPSRAACALLAIIALPACPNLNRDGDFAENASDFSVGFSLGSSSADETAGTHSVELTITATGVRNSTVVPVTVPITYTTDSSATGGEDFTDFTSTTVVFDMGSEDGATKVLDLELLSDTTIEGTESIVLRIGVPGEEAEVGTAEHVVDVLDANEATLRFTEPTSATPDEGDADYTLDVRARVHRGRHPAGGRRGHDLRPRRGHRDLGVDYAAFDPVVVVFPMTGTPGETRSVTVSVIDDADAEGDETVVLGLATDAIGVNASPATHVMTITEDEDVPGPEFGMVLDPDGAGTAFSNGGSIDFGSWANGGGASDPVRLRLTNAGIETLTISAPAMSGTDVREFAIDLDTETAGFLDPPVDVLAPLFPVDNSAEKGLELALDPDRLTELAQFERVALFGLVDPDGRELVLDLERVASPWTAGAILSLDGVPREGGPEAVLGDLSIWRGSLRGYPESRVLLSFSEHGSRGYVRRSSVPSDTLWLVQERLPDGGRTTRLATQEQLPIHDDLDPRASARPPFAAPATPGCRTADRGRPAPVTRPPTRVRRSRPLCVVSRSNRTSSSTRCSGTWTRRPPTSPSSSRRLRPLPRRRPDGPGPRVLQHLHDLRRSLKHPGRRGHHPRHAVRVPGGLVPGRGR